jgi:hypothetical protein
MSTKKVYCKDCIHYRYQSLNSTPCEHRCKHPNVVEMHDTPIERAIAKYGDPYKINALNNCGLYSSKYNVGQCLD